MGTALTVGLVALCVLAALLLTYFVVKSFIFVVHKGTVLVVKRLGDHHAVYEAGPHFRIPFLDTPHRTFDSQRHTLTLDLKGDSGGRLPVEMTVDLELEGVIDTAKVLDLAYNVTNPMQHLRGVAVAEVRQLLLPMAFEEIMTDAELAGRIANKLATVAAECGYKIIEARITSIRPDRTVHEAIVDNERNKHIRADQTAEAEHQAAMQLKLAGSAAAASAIEAQADRDRLDGQTEQTVYLLAMLNAAGVSKDNASALITALLNQQTTIAVGTNGKAHVVLTSPGLTLPDSIEGVTARQLDDAAQAPTE